MLTSQKPNKTENGLKLERRLQSRVKNEYNYAKYQVVKEKNCQTVETLKS